jgi:hypothetical protein
MQELKGKAQSNHQKLEGERGHKTGDQQGTCKITSTTPVEIIYKKYMNRKQKNL